MSDSDDEDYVAYGTPLEPIDEDNVPRKKPITIEEQIATDKHGRRRFHGAFTGGFSAGFFNSVGSLEGWKPTSFKSSRSSKADNHVQKPEDFMDEEDRDEFGIAPTVLRAKPEYGGSKGTKRGRPALSEGPIPGEPVLKSILEPVRETVGVRMLMKMGWKPGQGVGPRVTRSEKRRSRKSGKNDSKVYGGSKAGREEEGDGSESSESDAEDLLAQVLFAPDEKKPYLVQPKEDTFGMGYKGLDRRPVLTHINLFEPEPLKLQDKKKKLSIRGQAFGVGAFEDDDEDIYSKDDLSQYDFALESHSTLAARRKEERKNKLLAIAGSSDVLEGFVGGKAPPVRKKFFHPPEVPHGFVPNPRKSRFDASGAQVERSSGRLTALDRAVIIGESTGERKPQESVELPADKPKSAETLFRPFESDLEKQGRYDKYLKFLKIGAKDAFSKIQPASMTEWEKDRELAEFDKAAKLYAPLSGFMAERFTPGRTKDEPSEEEGPPAAPESDAAAAARAGMHGKLTREVSDWVPSSLVCKRFNIPQPHSDETMAKVASQKNKGKLKFSIFDFLEASKHNNISSLQCPEGIKQEPRDLSEDSSDQQPGTSGASSGKTLASVEKDMDFDEPEDRMDLFKAIFLSGSENESEDEDKDKSDKVEGKGGTEDLAWRSSYPGSDAALVNALRNTSPPRGIFANLDLDALSSKRERRPAEEVEGPAAVAPVEKDEASDVLLYGPRLPSAPPAASRVLSTPPGSSSSDSEGEWVEKDADVKGKSKKKSKKQKKEKKKSKHKHKKKKKHK